MASFYGGQENGPIFNPSPVLILRSCLRRRSLLPVVRPRRTLRPVSRNWLESRPRTTRLALELLQQGFPSNSLSDPNAPELYRSLNPRLVTPYTQQWHLGLEYQLPADTVSRVSYGGFGGLKLFAFYNGNQATPDPNASDRWRRAGPATNNNWPGETGGPCSLTLPRVHPGQYCHPPSITSSTPSARTLQSNYNSLQVRLEKRYSHGLQ